MFYVFSISDGFATGPEKRENFKTGDEEYEGGGSSSENEKCKCENFNTYTNLYVNCTEGCQKKYKTKNEYECRSITSYKSGEEDCKNIGDNKDSACKLWVTGNRADEFEITPDCITYPKKDGCQVTSKQSGIVAMMKQDNSNSFYNMTFSCLRKEKETHLYLNSYNIYGIKTNNGCEYRNPSLSENHTDDEYNRYKDFFKNKEFCILKKNGTIKNDYDNFKSYTYGWSSSGSGKHSIVVNGVVKYLEHGYFSAYVRLFCEHDDDGSAYVSTLRELKGPYGNREIHCLYGYKPNDTKTDCVKNHVVCAPGKYLPNGKTVCEECEEGYYCPGSKEKIKYFNSYNGKKYSDYRNHGGIFVFGKEATDHNGTKDKGQGIHKCKTVKTPVEAITEQTFGGKGDYSPKRTISDNDCYYNCDDNKYFPAGSTKSEDCEACPSGYYCTGGQFHTENKHQGIKLCTGGEGEHAKYLGDDKKCHLCSELYTGDKDTEDPNQDYSSALIFHSKGYELTDGKPSGFANNSNSNPSEAKQSCYISGGVLKGDVGELYLYEDCYYVSADIDYKQHPNCKDNCRIDDGSEDCENCVKKCFNFCKDEKNNFDEIDKHKCIKECNKYSDKYQE